jgi:hypothetical protein
LGNVGDEISLYAVGFPVNEGFARGLGDEIETGLEEGGFSGAIGPDASGEGAFGDIEFHIPEDGFAVVGHGEIVDREGEFRWMFGTHL